MPHSLQTGRELRGRELLVETLVVGDHYVAADHYVRALREVCGADFGPVRTVDWGGTKAEQHEVQGQMEWRGVAAVPVPTEIVDAVGEAEVLTLHFAPVPAAVLDAGKRLRAVVVARAGLENVDIEAATARGVAVSGITGRPILGRSEQCSRRSGHQACGRTRGALA